MTWDELESRISGCHNCPLGETRTNLVFGVGQRKAEIMLIGEGPGEQEDLTGTPFVGPAGKLLDDMLKIIKLSRERNVYIANIVKCRPPRNRDPKKEEQDACIGYLREQFRLIDPKIVICLGRIAAMAIIKEDFKITMEHGQWFDVGKAKAMAIYHPSALLRDPSRRPETFEDLMKIEQMIKETGVII